MGSGGMAAVLYDPEPMKEGWQLLPSVWWDVIRDILAHSLLHAPLGSGLCLVGWPWGRGGVGGGPSVRTVEGGSELLCVWTKLSVTY